MNPDPSCGKQDGSRAAHPALSGVHVSAWPRMLDVVRVEMSHKTGSHARAHAADRLGVSPATLYRYIPAARTAHAP
jgi:hypothetical protein